MCLLNRYKLFVLTLKLKLTKNTYKLVPQAKKNIYPEYPEPVRYSNTFLCDNIHYVFRST